MQTLGSGIERITDVTRDQPKSQLIHTFPENWCGVPTIVGHYRIQSVPVIHSLIVLDIADRTKPVEKSRLALNDSQRPHWTGWNIRTQRLVVTGSESRLYLLKLDETASTLGKIGRAHV